MSSIKSLLPYVLQWVEFSEEKQLNFNGYLLCYQGESVIIDPPFFLDSEFSPSVPAFTATEKKTDKKNIKLIFLILLCIIYLVSM